MQMDFVWRSRSKNVFKPRTPILTYFDFNYCSTRIYQPTPEIPRIFLAFNKYILCSLCDKKNSTGCDGTQCEYVASMEDSNGKQFQLIVQIQTVFKRLKMSVYPT